MLETGQMKGLFGGVPIPPSFTDSTLCMPKVESDPTAACFSTIGNMGMIKQNRAMYLYQQQMMKNMPQVMGRSFVAPFSPFNFL